MKTRSSVGPRYVWVWAALAVILSATLFPRPGQGPSSAMTPWYCLLCGDEGLVDVLLNIALFVPLGLALVHARWRPARAVLAGALLAVAIELLQATLVPGRDASLSDVVTDTVGTLAGALLAVGLPTLWRPGVARARQLGWGASLGWLALTWGTSMAVQPDRPEGLVRPAVAPATPLLQQFAGRVLGTRADGPDSDGAIRLSATVVTAGLTDRLAPVVQLDDDDPLALARLGQMGQKPTFSRRLRATRWRLRTPTVRAYGGAIPPSASAVALSGGYEAAVLWTASSSARGRFRGELALTPGIGWLLILPVAYPFDQHVDWVSGLWLALPLLLVGYWVGRARSQRWVTLAAGALLLVAGLWGPGTVLVVAPVRWPTWLMSVLGLLLGGWWGRRGGAATTTST